MSFSFLKGSNVPFSEFSVTSRKFAISKLIFTVILNPSIFNAFVIFFLYLSSLGPIGSFMMISPSSQYNPMFSLSVILDSWKSMRIPSSSHIFDIRASYGHIEVLVIVFFVHGFLWKRSDLRQCYIILKSSFEIFTYWAANSIAQSSVFSVMRG